jgi:hypothetical protein
MRAAIFSTGSQLDIPQASAAKHTPVGFPDYQAVNIVSIAKGCRQCRLNSAQVTKSNLAKRLKRLPELVIHCVTPAHCIY